MGSQEMTLEEIQQGSFKVLLKIKEICEKEHINYALVYGTLLGAIRHQGFIPWDDDIDVMMPRHDYERFVNYCIQNKDIIKPLELMHYKTNENYIYPIARLSDSRYTILYNCAKDYGLGLFVDVYPFDGIDPKDNKFIRKNNMRIKKIALIQSKKYIKSKSFLKNIFKFPLYLLSRRKNLNKMLEKHDKLTQKYSFEHSDYVCCTCWESKNILPKKAYSNFEMHLFNGVEFPISTEYEFLLKKSYGNYMELPPENLRVGHHDYKAYRRIEARKDE